MEKLKEQQDIEKLEFDADCSCAQPVHRKDEQPIHGFVHIYDGVAINEPYFTCATCGKPFIDCCGFQGLREKWEEYKQEMEG